MNDKYARIWKESAVNRLHALLWNSSTEGNKTQNTSFRLAAKSAEIRTGCPPPNRCPERYRCSLTYLMKFAWRYWRNSRGLGGTLSISVISRKACVGVRRGKGGNGWSLIRGGSRRRQTSLNPVLIRVITDDGPSVESRQRNRNGESRPGYFQLPAG